MKFSEKLKALGFMGVYDVMEHTNKPCCRVQVSRGRPYTIDVKGGTIAAYDEEGRAWVYPSAEGLEALLGELMEYNLTFGAYVPFMEDYDFYRDNILPLIRTYT